MVIGGETKTSVGPMPEAVEDLRTINFLTDCGASSTLIESTPSVADESLDFDPSAVASSSTVDVISSIGANVEVVTPPIRRRQPRHGLGNLDSVDVSTGRKFRENVSRDPAKCVDRVLKDLHIERVRSSLARTAKHEKWADQAHCSVHKIYDTKSIFVVQNMYYTKMSYFFIHSDRPLFHNVCIIIMNTHTVVPNAFQWEVFFSFS